MYLEMGSILLVVEIVFSIFLPLWLYYWFRKIIKKQSVSNSDFKYNNSSIHFSLKRWWAERCIVMRRKKKTNLNKYEKNHLKNSRIKDKNSINSFLFYATDQKGNSVFIKFCQRGFKTVEVLLYLTTSDGQIYVLPVYPDTTLVNSFNQEWTAGGLKIELLEAQQCWRIVYNGMLKNLTQGDEYNEENIQHVRLNFLFIANSEPLKWPDDWSSRLHAEALAREPWRSPEWMNKITLLDYTGFDQFGSMLGQIRYKDDSVSTLYLRGLHQHRWGKHESHEFYKSVTLFGIMPYGAMYYLNTSSTKHSFPRILCGQFRDNNENIRKIDKMEVDLDDFTQDKFTNNMKCKMRFTVEEKEYNILTKHDNQVTLYNGQPWGWVNIIATIKLELNGKSGTGLIQLCHPYNGPCQEKTPMKLHYLKQFHTYVQKTDYVVHFDDAKCQNENIVGGKGFSLAMLTSIKDKNFIVPKGFCVTVFALEIQLRTHKKLQKIINDIEDVSVGKKEGDLQKYCYEAIHIIQSTPIIDEVQNAIVKAIEILESENNNDESNRYAVRSSAVGEDSEETSAAGQNSTYLGIQGVENIIKSIAMCWASLFSYQSVTYRKQNGLLIKASMGVCVQKMVNADAAGVMFTRHPTTGDPSSIVITANYGLGETVVSAAIEPDTIIVYKSWDNELTVKSFIPGNKRHKMLAYNNELNMVELNDQESKAVCISEQIALQLAAVGVNIENLFNSARDIEWAVIADKIYLLQARPITTLYSWTEFELMHELDTGVPSDIDLIMFSNLSEVFPDPLSPLTRSFMIEAFNKAIANACSIPCRQFFCIVGMKIVINYYTMILRDTTKEISLFNKAVDIAFCGSVVVTPEIHRIAKERNGVITFRFRMKLLYKMLKEAIQNSMIVKIAKETCQNLILNAEDFYTSQSLYNEISKKYSEYIKVTQFHMITTRVSITYQVFLMILLTKGYKNFVPDHFSDIALLLGSCKDIIGIEVVNQIKKIINYIKKSDKDEEFKKLDPTKTISWLKLNCPLAAKELENLLKEQGHRAIQELDLWVEPWSLKPENLIIMLQTLIASPKMSNTNKPLNAEETVASLKTPKSALIKFLLKKFVPLCRSAVVRREITKSLFVNALHKFRLAYKRLGKLMVLEQYLPEEDLVFFLTKEEIGQVLKHRNTIFIQKAYRRKRIFPQLKKFQYSEFNTGMPLPIENNVNLTMTNGCVKIQGTPICGGSVLGRACVVTDLSDVQQIQYGDILITRATDIAWSPYFPLLNGIVTELGGLISHGAVVAREYGLPCITGAKNVTKMFQTGDTVLMTADVGILQLIKSID